MNWYYVAAGCLAIVLGLVHSVLGEVLIFRQLGAGGPVSSTGAPVLGRRHVRILRVTWHVATFLAWGFGANLLRVSRPATPDAYLAFFESVTSVSFLACSMLTLFGTRGKHPGWVVLLTIAILMWVA